jgi:hypothetical protein
LLACCLCGNEPVGEFSINKLKIKEIETGNISIEGIGLELHFLDSTILTNPIAKRWSSLYTSANAMSPCDCPDRKTLIVAIKKIKIISLKQINSEYAAMSDVTNLFVTDIYPSKNSSNLLKMSIQSAIRELNNRDFFYSDGSPTLNLFFKNTEYQKPAQFRIELELNNGQTLTTTSPIYS